MSAAKNILIIDDDEHILLSGKMFLDQHFTLVNTITNPGLAPDLLEKAFYSVVLLDMNFSQGDTSGKDGLNWLRKIKELSPETSVILITAYGGIQTAVEAMKLGAFDFLVKPWENEKLLATVSAAAMMSDEKKENQKLKSQAEILQSDISHSFDEIVGESAAIKDVFKTIGKVATTPAEVLILGENGTGKELIARAIHNASDRRDNVFISVDLGSLSETLFESELFGHKKGAFTDAQSDRKGRFEAADGGTLFFDEIGNIPLSLQSKLLTAIQNKKITPIGSNQTIEVDVRILCATNKNLKQMVAEGTFREDLLFRINTVEVTLPPLRKRADDVPRLSDHFLAQFARKYGKKDLSIAPTAQQKMKSYKWPGNIRELQHALERAVIMCEGNVIEPHDLGLYNSASEIQQIEDLNLDNLEKWAVEAAIQKHKGNISYAAKELGLSRGAMYRRLEKYDL